MSLFHFLLSHFFTYNPNPNFTPILPQFLPLYLPQEIRPLSLHPRHPRHARTIRNLQILYFRLFFINWNQNNGSVYEGNINIFIRWKIKLKLKVKLLLIIKLRLKIKIKIKFQKNDFLNVQILPSVRLSACLSAIQKFHFFHYNACINTTHALSLHTVTIFVKY